MAKKLSHNQKRKAKLKKRAERARQYEAMGYYNPSGEYKGDYKMEESAPALFVTECGIMEAHLMLGRSLTDDDAENALESLIVQLREGLSLAPAEEDFNEIPDDPVGATIATIRRNWMFMAADGGELDRDELIDMLRSLIGVIRFWRQLGNGPTDYLHYLEEFLAEMGDAFEDQPQAAPRAVSSDAPEEPKALGSESGAS